MPYPALPSEKRVSQAIVDVLAEAGVRFVFGMPGGHTGVLFASLHDHPTIRVVQVREESIGSTAAEAFGRISGQPAVVMGQGEWIVGNAGQGPLEALLGSAPMLVLTEMSDGGAFSHHGPYQGGTGDYGAWDAKRALEGVTKRVMVSHYPSQAVQHTQLAIKHALTGEPGPVAVVYHSDSLRGRVGPESSPAIFPTAGYLVPPSMAVDVEATAAGAAAVNAAERPVIVAGNGVRVGQACGALMRLARKLDALVVTTAGGKGVIAERDPLALGVIGTFGHPAAIEGINGADVVIAVGTKLGPMDTCDQSPKVIDPRRQTLVQIDIEPLNVGWTFPVEHKLVGDAARTLDALTDACDQSDHGAARLVGDLLAKYDASGDSRFHSDDVPFHPQRVIGLLQEAVPGDAIVTADAGENRLFMMQWFRSVSPGGYLQPAAGGGMGYGVAAAIGAKLARPSQPVIAVCGDGGFAMSVHALMTAVQDRIPIGVVVLNNRALGWVLHGMGKRAVAAQFDEFDYAALAATLGCDSVRPQSIEQLEKALAAACSSATRPFVIDVPTSAETSFAEIEALPRLRP